MITTTAAISYHVANIAEVIRQRRQSNDPESGAKDLLTDFRHFCYANNLDFQQMLDSSLNHFLCERAEENLPVPAQHPAAPKAIVAVIRGGALQTVVATKNASDVRVYLVDLDNLEAGEEESGRVTPLDSEALNILDSGVPIW